MHIPWTRMNELVAAFKQSHRREDDIALVNAGMRLRCAPAAGGGWRVEEATLAYGGVAPCVVTAQTAASTLVELGLGSIKVRCGHLLHVPRRCLHDAESRAHANVGAMSVCNACTRWRSWRRRHPLPASGSSRQAAQTCDA